METTIGRLEAKTSAFDADNRRFDSGPVERRSPALGDIASFDLVPSALTPKRMTETLRGSGRKIVCVSGGYDPLHIGHIKQICDAKKLGSVLIVILNSDRFLLNKKGYYFLSAVQRKVILEHLRPVDYVYMHNPTDPNDMTVCEALIDIHPDIFAKGGDRSPIGTPIPEEKLCAELGIEVVYGVGGFDKVSSSSILVEEAFKRFENRRRK
jgi:cytidyltransferase-like protein